MFLLSSFVSAWSQSTKRALALSSFVIDENRPYVYLLFDHVGKAVGYSKDEPPTRVWLRFVNNCRVPIVLRTFGAPEGSSKEEAGLIHEVVKDVQFQTRGVKVEPPLPNRESSEPDDEPQMPAGYDSEVSSTESVPPGQSLLFSVPVTHLSKSWHLEIPYTFDLPRGKGPRLPVVGGEPQMVLLYSGWDLPDEVQKQLKIR